MRARLSGPPETATAIRGRASKPPSASSDAPSSPVVSGAVGPGLLCFARNDNTGSASEALLFRRRVLLDRGCRLREIVIQLRQGDAGVLLLIGAAERHRKLQQIVGCLGAFRIPFVALGKCACRLEEPVARVIGLAEPVLRIPRHRIRRMLLDKSLQ